MQTFLNIAQIVLAVVLIVAIMLQVRGGGLGGIFGQADTVFRTRRGIEKTMFQLTIIVAILFIIVSVVSLRVS